MQLHLSVIPMYNFPSQDVAIFYIDLNSFFGIMCVLGQHISL